MDQNNYKTSIWIAFFLILYNFCANLANDIYLPSMPELVTIFDTTNNTLQLTMTAWFAGVALPQLFFGPLTDRFGRRVVLFAGAVVFLIATLVCTGASGVWQLIIARFFQGVGVSSLNVTTFGILADLYEYKDRTKIMTKISMCGTLAPLLGPIVGGYILTYLGWRMNFVLIFTLAAISILGLWYKLPESNLYLNPYALNIRNIYKNYLLLLRVKGFLQNLLPYCLMLGGVVAYLTAAPFLIINTLQISAEYFGYTQLPVFIAFIIGSLWLGRVDNEAVIRKFATLGLVLVFFGGILFVVSSILFGTTVYSVIVPMLIYALGFSLCGSILINDVMTAATINKGSAAAFLGFSMATACVLASSVLGLLYNGSVLPLAVLIFVIGLFSSAIYFWSEWPRVMFRESETTISN